MKLVSRGRAPRIDRLGWLRAVTIAGLLTAAGFAAWSPAAVLAEGDPLASGKTELALRKALIGSWRKHDVRVRGRGRARFGGHLLTVRVAGGEVDPTTGKGVILHQGGIAFRHRGRTVSFDDLAINTTTRALTARVAGKATVLAHAREVSFVRDGLGTRIAIDRLLLTGNAARRLNSKLRLKGLFKGGQSLGTTSTASQPASVKLVPVAGRPAFEYSFGFLFFLPEPNALRKLEAKKVFYPYSGCLPACPPLTFGPVAGGLGPGFSMVFYITGGRLAVDGSSGILTTVSRVGMHSSDPANPSRLVVDSISLDLTSRTADADVELQLQSGAPGSLGRIRIGTLETTSSVTGPADARASLTGFIRPSANGSGTVFLGQAEATLLNQMFPGPPSSDFVAGDVFGKFNFHAAIR